MSTAWRCRPCLRWTACWSPMCPPRHEGRKTSVTLGRPPTARGQGLSAAEATPRACAVDGAVICLCSMLLKPLVASRANAQCKCKTIHAKLSWPASSARQRRRWRERPNPARRHGAMTACKRPIRSLHLCCFRSCAGLAETDQLLPYLSMQGHICRDPAPSTGGQTDPCVQTVLPARGRRMRPRTWVLIQSPAVPASASSCSKFCFGRVLEVGAHCCTATRCHADARRTRSPRSWPGSGAQGTPCAVHGREHSKVAPAWPQEATRRSAPPVH